ncbi:TetR/AcrR family transcriptional regulator [Arthrobacter sp. HLT1-20]
MSTSDAGRPGRRGPYAKSEERRRAILDAAHAVFAAKGYRGGSLQDVAGHAGMSQTSLLHHFPSKSALLMAVLERRDEITAAMPAEPRDDFMDTVLRTALYNEGIPGVIELYTVLCAESVTEGHPGRHYFTERFARLRASYTSQFAVLARDGRLRPGVDPAQAAVQLVALWDGLQTQWLLAPETLDVAQGLRSFFDLLVVPAGD